MCSLQDLGSYFQFVISFSTCSETDALDAAGMSWDLHVPKSAAALPEVYYIFKDKMMRWVQELS